MRRARNPISKGESTNNGPFVKNGTGFSVDRDDGKNGKRCHRLSFAFRMRQRSVFLWLLSLGIIRIWISLLGTPRKQGVIESSTVHTVQISSGDAVLPTPPGKGTAHRSNQNQSAYASQFFGLFDDPTSPHATVNSRTFWLWPNPEIINHSRLLDANHCVRERSRLGGRQSVRCLPSFVIAGFEKCGSSALNEWLQHHPRLLGPYGETRFFKSHTRNHLDLAWHKYLEQLPSTTQPLGSFFVYETSPGYINNLKDGQAMSQVIPSAKLLLLLRNPVDRAYSHFCMYTKHYLGATSAILTGPVSFFVRHGDEVDYVGDVGIVPGPGGSYHNASFRYVDFPPQPEDFDRYVRKKLQTISDDISDHSRGSRILGPGRYSSYLKAWNEYYDRQQMIVIPNEIFFEPAKVVDNMAKLQRRLGLPLFDYNTVLDKRGKWAESSSLWSTLLRTFHFNLGAEPMLNSTRILLNEYYCPFNKELRELLGNRRLPGYACADD